MRIIPICIFRETQFCFRHGICRANRKISSAGKTAGDARILLVVRRDKFVCRHRGCADYFRRAAVLRKRRLLSRRIFELGSGDVIARSGDNRLSSRFRVCRNFRKEKRTFPACRRDCRRGRNLGGRFCVFILGLRFDFGALGFFGKNLPLPMLPGRICCFAFRFRQNNAVLNFNLKLSPDDLRANPPIVPRFF